MKLDTKTLKNIEKLAKITVDEQQQYHTMKKMSELIDIIDNFEMSSLVDLEPLHHPLEISQELRKDIPQPHSDREELQHNAPKVSKGLFLVPKVIE